jgi:hypothetical protein
MLLVMMSESFHNQYFSPGFFSTLWVSPTVVDLGWLGTAHKMDNLFVGSL